MRVGDSEGAMVDPTADVGPREESRIGAVLGAMTGVGPRDGEAVAISLVGAELVDVDVDPHEHTLQEHGQAFFAYSAAGPSHWPRRYHAGQAGLVSTHETDPTELGLEVSSDEGEGCTVERFVGVADVGRMACSEGEEVGSPVERFVGAAAVGRMACSEGEEVGVSASP
jgi:hypothetical protein